jgi:hypothetical protein
MDKTRLKKVATRTNPTMDNILRFLTSPLCDAASVIRIIPRTIAASDGWLRIIIKYPDNTEIKSREKDKHYVANT